MFLRACKDEKKNIFVTTAIVIDGTRFDKAQVTTFSGQSLFLTSVKLTYYHNRLTRKISIVCACLELKSFVQITSLSDLLLPHVHWTGATEAQVAATDAMLDVIKDNVKSSAMKTITFKPTSSPKAALPSHDQPASPRGPRSSGNKQKANTEAKPTADATALREVKKEYKRTQAALVALEGKIDLLQATMADRTSTRSSPLRSRSRSPSQHGHVMHRSRTVHEYHHHRSHSGSPSRSRSRSRSSRSSSRSRSRSRSQHRHGRHH